MNRFLILIAIFCSFNSFSQLSGTYTIGGASPNYPTIDSAINSLHSLGVNGAVTFNIRKGNYTSRIIIDSIPGMGAANPITIQTDPASSSMAHISYSSNTIILKRSSNLIFKRLKISTSDTSAVLFKGKNHKVSFIQDSLIGKVSSSSSMLYSVMFDYSSTVNEYTDSISVDSCTILNGSISILFLGSRAGIKNNDLHIENCNLVNFRYKGVWVDYSPRLKVKNCKMRTTSAFAYSFVRTMHSSYIEISGNDMFNSSNQLNCRLIYITRAYGNSTTPGSLVFNNLLAFDNPVKNKEDHGIKIVSCSYPWVINNSIYLNSDSTISCPLKFGYTTKVKVLNNSFCNVGLGPALIMHTPTSGDTIDNNNYYTNGTNLIRAGSVIHTSIATWKFVTKGNGAINVWPGYKSKSDLHLFNFNLVGKGKPLTYITEDVDGEKRDLLKPDIGADELYFYGLDASIDSVYSSSICEGRAPVKVYVKNLGSAPILSSKINWSVKTNSGAYVPQTPFKLSSNLKSLQDTLVTIGYFTFNDTDSYSIIAHIDSVNSTIDINPSNDSAVASLVETRMSGLYIVGNRSTDRWTRIDSAVKELERRGVCAPVTIYIRSGVYNESIKINTIPFTNRNDTVLFLGDTTSRARIHHTTRVFFFENIRNFTLQNLDIELTVQGNAIFLYKKTGNFNLIDCNLKGPIDFIKYSSINTLLIKGKFHDNIGGCRILNNTFKYGAHSIYWIGGGAYFNRTDSGNVFSNNTFINPSTGGLRVVFQQSASILENSFILDTNILNPNYGIYVEDSKHSLVKRNRIVSRNLNKGIYMNDENYWQAGGSLIANNFISVGDTVGSTGIECDRCTHVDIIHNSVLISGGVYSSSYGLKVYAKSDDVKIKNNSISNQANGTACYLDPLNKKIYSNYNNFHSNGSNLGWLGSNASNLSTWKVLSKLDSNSISIDPEYNKWNDLHLSSPFLVYAGDSTAIRFDIDGQTRDTLTPTIGADEIRPFSRDVRIYAKQKFAKYCEGTLGIQWELRNVGDSTVKSIELLLEIRRNGILEYLKADTLNVNLKYKDVINYNLSNYKFRDSLYTVTLVVNTVNKLLDLNSTNDTAVYSVSFNSKPFLVVGTMPKLCSNDSVIKFSFASSNGNLNYYGPKVINGVFNPKTANAGLHTFRIISGLSNGCFTFIDTAIKVDQAPLILMNTDTIVCNDQTPFLLNYSLPKGGKYSGNFVTSNVFNTTGAGAGIHNIKYLVNDTNGCSDSMSARINILNPLVAVVDSIVPFCSKDSILKLNSGRPQGGYYYGRNIDSVSSNYKVSDTLLGNYDFGYVYQDSNACVDTAHSYIKIVANPKVNLGADTTYCGTNVLILKSNALSVSNKWSTGDTSSSIKVAKRGVYWLIISDSNSCIGSDTILVSYKAVCVGIDENLLSNGSILYYPNPNNGRFTLKLNANFTGKVELIIRNTQGQLVAAKTWEKLENDLIQEIDLEHQSSGIYFLELLTPFGKAQHRITLNR